MSLVYFRVTLVFYVGMASEIYNEKNISDIQVI